MSKENDARVEVRCLEGVCANHGKLINVITGGPEDELEDTADQWPDSSEQADVCPLCGKLGEAEFVPATPGND